MAENEVPEEEELSEEEIQAAVERAAKTKKLIMLGATGLVLLLLAGGGTVLALKFLGGEDKPEVAAEVKADEGEAAKPAEEVSQKGKTAFYDALDPAFLANFMVGGRQHYVQVSLTVMTREEEALPALKTHMPLVRNRIVMLLSGESFEHLQTDEGRVQLQQKLLTAIQEIMIKETGKPRVEQIFFTNFVMQ